MHIPINIFTCVKEKYYCNEINKKGGLNESTDECLFYL